MAPILVSVEGSTGVARLVDGDTGDVTYTSTKRGRIVRVADLALAPHMGRAVIVRSED